MNVIYYLLNVFQALKKFIDVQKEPLVCIRWRIALLMVVESKSCFREKLFCRRWMLEGKVRYYSISAGVQNRRLFYVSLLFLRRSVSSLQCGQWSINLRPKFWHLSLLEGLMHSCCLVSSAKPSQRKQNAQRYQLNSAALCRRGSLQILCITAQ